MTLRLLIAAIAAFSFSSAMAQDNTNFITTLRMGPFKIGSKKEEVEKTANVKLQISNTNDADTLGLVYNGKKYQLIFQIPYDDETNIKKLYSVSSKETDLKTKSNMGIGSTKPQLLVAYDKIDMRIYNDWNYTEKKNLKDKVRFVQLFDNDNNSILSFTTVDRVVTEVEVVQMPPGD
jgi:hypothetical protein